jgi:hypothetical protein
MSHESLAWPHPNITSLPGRWWVNTVRAGRGFADHVRDGDQVIEAGDGRIRRDAEAASMVMV